jgi:hypothetical protein
MADFGFDSRRPAEPAPRQRGINNVFADLEPVPLFVRHSRGYGSVDE